LTLVSPVIGVVGATENCGSGTPFRCRLAWLAIGATPVTVGDCVVTSGRNTPLTVWRLEICELELLLAVGLSYTIAGTPFTVLVTSETEGVESPDAAWGNEAANEPSADVTSVEALVGAADSVTVDAGMPLT
jgi:hypothetical protein